MKSVFHSIVKLPQARQNSTQKFIPPWHFMKSNRTTLL